MMIVCKAKPLVRPQDYCPGVTQQRSITRMLGMSVRHSIGPNSLVAQALSICSSVWKPTVSMVLMMVL